VRAAAVRNLNRAGGGQALRREAQALGLVRVKRPVVVGPIGEREIEEG